MANEGKTSGIDMQETLFGAMYEIARGVIAQQEFDITKECKIIEVYLDSKGERTGVYKVKHQNATYDAYAQQGDIYNLDQWVYVQIPNGDYNSNKFIVGQKVNKDDASDIYNLRLPFDNFLGLYNLTMSTPMEEHGYWANNPAQGASDNLIAEADENGLYYPKNGDHLWHWENISGTAMYATQLGLEVDITTLLHGFSLVSGNYGIRVAVKGLGYNEENKDQIKDLTKEFYFDTASMYGNSYAYTMGTTQQCVLDIKNFLRVDAIDLWFWQDHEFKDEAGTRVPYTSLNVAELEAKLAEDIEAVNNEEITATEKKKKINDLYLAFSAKISNTAERPNISFNNLRVLLGLALDQLSEETAYLYTYDTLKYGADGTAESGEVKTADRTLNLAWVHKYNNTAELIDTYGALEEAGARVYWYYYDPEWTSENVLYDYENYSHRFGGMYWRPFEIDETVVIPDGMELSYIVSPDVQKNVSKYKAVIHYNNTYVTSNIITFANVEAVETNNANLARNDKVILRISQIRKIKDDGSTILETDDTLGNFFVYDENNAVLANSDNVKFSDVKYYIEPWIKVSEYDPENPEETDNKYGYQRLVDYVDMDTGKTLNFTINWQFPDSMRYTMIKSWGMLDDSCRSESYWNSRSEMQFARDCEATRYFQISPLLDAQYGNNDIGAVIDIAGMGTFNVKKELIFGQACSFGCEYTPVITISAPAGNSYIDTNTEFEMYCVVYDRQGKILDENLRNACEFEWKYYGTNNKPLDNRPHENYMGFVGNVIKGRITQPYPFVVEVTVKGAAAYDITVRRGIMVGNDSGFMQTHDIMCPSRVEFRSDGQAPIYQSNAFEVAIIKEDGTENELIYPEWKINNEQVLTLVESISTYPDLVSPTGSYFTKPEDNTCYALAFSAHTLNSNSANPNAYAQQWTDDLLTDEMFTYISFTYGTAVVAQAIAFAQNLYPSSLVNEWDGQSLSLDEENSAIIAKMIAAGTKDQKNRFTGVMMGDWSEKGDSSLDVPGLYGFNAGAQSFGFKTDGTGFIGPAGEGRIQFDGRNALISNSAKTCYINLNPRRVEQFMTGDDTNGYTLDNQAWDSVGNQSYSQYFLYSKAPRRVNSFSYTEDDGTKTDNSTAWVANWDQHTDLLWVKPFMEDADNDYFVVDPNYGVATTGGIFARYGRLGHEYPWIISDYGLTQKNIYGRIFLGNPEKNLSVGQNIPTPKFTNETNNEIEVPTNFFSASFANVKNVIQTGIRADGYLYTRYAAIGGWYVNDNEIYSVDSETYESDDSNKGFRKAHSDDGYKKDLLNINSKNQFISFNNGRFIINGKHGWMGFYSHQNEDKTYDTIELIKSPTAYNMLIDFNEGTINFGKDKPSERDESGTLIATIPHVKIDGKDGKAYFAKGNIIIDGENAKIFCGVPTNPLSATSNYAGTLQLADVDIEAITDNIDSDPLEAVFGISGQYSAQENTSPGTTEDQENLERFSNIWSSSGSEYSVTLDEIYNPSKQYYVNTNGTKYNPTTDTTATVMIGSEFVTIQNKSTLLTRLNISTTTPGSYTKTFSRSVSGELQEDDTVIDRYGNWTMDNVLITDISDWGLSITSETLLLFSIVITITITNWQPRTYYEYGKAIEDLTEFTKFNTTIISSTASSQGITYNPTGVLSFTQNGVGMQLYLEDGDTVKQTLLMPRGINAAGRGLLYNWDIDAKNIYVQSQLKSMGTIEAPAILMPVTVTNSDGTTATQSSLVATEYWVNLQIVDKVWPKVVTVNNAASRAMQKAKAAYDLAQDAIDKAKDALAGVVTDVTVTQESSDNGMSYFGIVLTKAGGGTVNATGSILKSRQIWAAHATHQHDLTITMSGTKLKIAMGNVKQASAAKDGEYDLDSVFVRKISGDSTTGKLSWEGGEGGSGNFNIADTQFYKDGVEAAYEDGWKDAIATLSLSGSGNTATASVGNATYGSASLSTTATLGRDMTGSHDFGEAGRTWYYNITATAPGVWSASASKKIGYRYLYSGATGKITGWSVAK